MNLWDIFPESILQIKGILYLKYMAMVIYLYIFYLLIKHPAYRRALILFFVLTVGANMIMIFTPAPALSVFSPLSLVMVIIMPISMLIFRVFKKKREGISVWVVASVASLLHGFSWAIWVFAMAGS